MTVKILLVVVGILGGFGGSQLTVAGRVMQHDTEIANMKVADERLAKMFEESMALNRQLVAELQAQRNAK